MRADVLDDSVGQFFPASILVGVGLALTNSKASVQKQHALFCPSFKKSVIGNYESGDIFLQLLVHVDQRWWSRNSLLNRKAKAVSLTWSVIWILAENYDLCVLDIGVMSPTPDLLSRWEDLSIRNSLIFKELAQAREVLLLEFRFQGREPSLEMMRSEWYVETMTWTNKS